MKCFLFVCYSAMIQGLCIWEHPLSSSLLQQQSFSFLPLTGLHQRARFFTQPALGLSCKTLPTRRTFARRHQSEQRARLSLRACMHVLVGCKNRPFPIFWRWETTAVYKIISSVVSGTTLHFMQRGIPNKKKKKHTDLPMKTLTSLRHVITTKCFTNPLILLYYRNKTIKVFTMSHYNDIRFLFSFFT